MVVINSKYSDFKLMSAESAKHRNCKDASDAKFLPKFGRIVTCRQASPSRTFGQILRPNFSPSLLNTQYCAITEFIGIARGCIGCTSAPEREKIGINYRGKL